MGSSSSDWVQLYEQANNIHRQATSSFGLSDADATNVATSTGASDIIINPSSSITSSINIDGDHQTLAPKGICASSKPIKRRSRASKKTPTTLLNASTSNFRALVQQFTGCPSTSISLIGSRKGPINLNFGLGSTVQNHHTAYTTSTAEMATFDDNSYCHRETDQMQQRRAGHQTRQNGQQWHQGQGSRDDDLPNYSNAYFSSVSSDLGPNLDMPPADHDDGFFNMDDIALQELAKESFSDENMNNINCF